MPELPHKIKYLDFEDIEGERVFFWWTLYFLKGIIIILLHSEKTSFGRLGERVKVLSVINCKSVIVIK